MLKLEAITKDARLAGLDLNGIVRVVSVEAVGTDAVTVYFKGSDGKLAEQMLFRTDEARLSLAEAGRAWAFDAPADGYKLGLEAYRIRLAHLFDPMMAVDASNVQPLPHQITAVSEAMVPRQPLRSMLADDPGAALLCASEPKRYGRFGSQAVRLGCNAPRPQWNVQPTFRRRVLRAAVGQKPTSTPQAARGRIRRIGDPTGPVLRASSVGGCLALLDNMPSRGVI